jgi:hypothetical protein
VVDEIANRLLGARACSGELVISDTGEHVDHPVTGLTYLRDRISAIAAGCPGARSYEEVMAELLRGDQ